MFFPDVIFFLNFSLFAFALPLYCAVNYKVHPEKSFLPSFILNSALFFIFAIFHITGIGFRLIYIANMLLYVPTVLKMRKLRRDDFVQSVFTPGTVILFSMMTLLFFLVRNEECYSWDSISHWMTSVKFFFDDEKLCCEYPVNILLHASYPPGMCMMSMLVHKCFFGLPFREGIVIFAHTLPIYAGLAWLFSKIRYGQKYVFLAAVSVSSFLIPLFIHIGCFFLCYTDLCLAVVMAVTFYQMVSTMRDYKISDYLLLALLNCWMYMIRNAGWGYSLAVMVFFGVFLFVDRRKAFCNEVSGKISKAKIAAAGSVFLLPVLLKCIWEFLLRYYSTTLRFGGTNITWSGIRTAFGSTDSLIWKSLKAFLMQISVQNIPVLVVIIIAACIMIKKFSDPVMKRGLKITVYFFVPAAVLFLGTMFIYYYFEFGVLDVFPSLHRYFFNFAIIPILIIILFVLEYYAEKEQEAVMNKRARYIFYTVIAVLILCGGFLSVLKIPRITIYRKWRLECDRIRKYESLIRPGVRFGHISTTGSGFKSFYLQYRYPYQHLLFFKEDPVLKGSSKNNTRADSTPFTLEELQNEFKKADYVFMDNPREDFIEDFSGVFVSGFNPALEDIQSRMFKVTPDGKLAPVD